MNDRDSMIVAYSPEEVERFTRFFFDDRESSERRISFVQANFNQHVMIQRPRDLPYQVFNHDQIAIKEILEEIPHLGLDLPDEFYRGTSVYNINGVLMDKGVTVLHRVLRQQIFLGSSVDPIPSGQTHHFLFNAIGNAIWNFLDHSVWRDRTVKYERKNHYKSLRGLEPDNQGRAPSRPKHQQNLFYVASEDFRYFFGSILAGRNEWYLDQRNEPDHWSYKIIPPKDEVADFWRQELSKYENTSNRREETHTESRGTSKETISEAREDIEDSARVI